MMTNRSAHIPTLMRMEATKRTTSLRRAHLNQKTCGTRTLQKSCTNQIAR